jgi:hypothetical protein
MPLLTETSYPERAVAPRAPYGLVRLRAYWDERIVTFAAAAIAVLIVAAIAVLMGMT